MALSIRLAPRLLRRFGYAVLDLIHENIAEGIDSNDEEFAPYSEKPFARPAGGITKRALVALDKRGQLVWYKRGGKATWVVIIGGYLALKRAKSPRGSAKVDLTDRGLMLQSLGVTSVVGTLVQIGFNDEEAAELAYYHNVVGAGKSHTIRHFLGLTERKYGMALDAAIEDNGDNQDFIVEGSLEL